MPNFHITLDTPLALHGVGKTSGLIVNVGEGVTSVAAVYEGRIYIVYSLLRQQFKTQQICRNLAHFIEVNSELTFSLMYWA